MSIDERISGYSDKELASLRDNVHRLASTGSIMQRNEAERLIPLIAAELDVRKTREPVRAERKAPVRKARVAKAKAPKASAKAAKAAAKAPS